MRRLSERLAASNPVSFAAAGTDLVLDRGAGVAERRIPAATAAPRLMLLTSNLGMGHLRTAQAIIAAMRSRFSQPSICTLNFWSLMHSGIADVVHDIYLRLVQQYPGLYDSMHGLDEHTWRRIFQSNEPPLQAVVDALQLICAMCPPTLPNTTQNETYASDRIVYPILRAALPSASGGMKSGGVLRLGVVHWMWRTLGRRMAQQIQRFAPDVIVSTQMLPASLLSSIKHRRAWRIPSIGVLTDYGIHDFWVQQQTNHYCVAHEEIANVSASGLPPYCMSHTGVPLMPGFAAPPSQSDARVALGFDIDRPIVLVLGGGLGLGIESLTQQLLALPARTQLAVLIGRNSHAEERLRNLSSQHAERLKVLGWTDQVEYLMRAADIVVGKPGGLTVAEVLACGRPLFATRSLGGQEGFNLRFLEQHGVGKLVAEEGLIAVIDELLQAPDRLRELQDRAWSLGRRNGAERVVEIAQRFACAPRVALGSR